MSSCKDNLNCRQISDFAHRKEFLHNCIYGPACKIKSKNHIDQFTHNKISRIMCPNSFGCLQINNKDHQIQFNHECISGELCNNINPDHHILFNHLNQHKFLPVCNCDNGEEKFHNQSYSHVCKIPDCKQGNDLNHTKYWLHPMPFCPSRLICSMADYSQHHRINYRHLCQMGLECSDINNSIHALRFFHIDINSELPRCPDLNQCCNDDPQHNWEYSHLCRSFNCGNGMEHRILFYHNNSVVPITSFEGFWYKTGISTAVKTNTVTFQSIPYMSEEHKLISDKFLKTVGFSTITIHSIERVINPALAALYMIEQKKVALNNNDDFNEQLMFHGSKNWKNIFEKGFDYRFANDGRFGRGNYFAFNASYSHGGYVGQDDQGNTVMIVAHVLVGKSVETPPNSLLTVVPNGGDSVVEPNVMCIVYNDNRAYPSYLIRYK